MIKTFRVISLLEGLSYLAILSVTLGFISREYVSPLGMTHGILFTLYMMLSLSLSNKHGWPVWKWLVIMLASVIPFAFIPAEIYLRKMKQETVQEEAAA